MRIEKLLEAYKAGDVTLDEVLGRLKELPFADIGYAKLDTGRRLRKGFPEVIFCLGKTNEQLSGIIEKMSQSGENVFLTKVSDAQADYLTAKFPPLNRDDDSKTLFLEQTEIQILVETAIPVLSAGTADIPVAAEAVRTIEVMGHKAERIFDVGVAGIHRFFAHKEKIEKANVIVVVAGMDGVLPSVVGGLVDAPLIAVPTSIGYGASFGGLSALMTMLNSCAPGVAVVNIDNGFGAGYIAAKINEIAVKDLSAKDDD